MTIRKNAITQNQAGRFGSLGRVAFSRSDCGASYPMNTNKASNVSSFSSPIWHDGQSASGQSDRMNM